MNLPLSAGYMPFLLALASTPAAAPAAAPLVCPPNATTADMVAARNEMQARTWDHHCGAVAMASAFGDMAEGRRPNSFVGLNTATPAVAIGAGASTGTMSVSLPAYSEIVTFSVNDADATDFVVDSLVVNGWQWNKGGAAANLSMLQSVAERFNAPAPLIGRSWEGTIVITASCTNLNAATRIFHGITVWVYNGECLEKFEAKSEEVQGFHQWTNVLARTKAASSAMGIVSVA